VGNINLLAAIIFISRTASGGRMKGTYCLLFALPRDVSVRVGALGKRDFPAGAYVYVGSALGGVEGRVGRHRRAGKRKKWHIDYLLDKGEVVATIVVPSDEKRTECSVARSMVSSGEAEAVVPGFGSSDCRCPSHLLYLGDIDPERAAETVSMAITMLASAYRRTID
jgi:sugar fermentation stimulation protein A